MDSSTIKTEYTKDRRDGWRGTSIIELGEVKGEGMRILDITTYKHTAGGVATRATVMMRIDGAAKRWVLGQDFSHRYSHEPGIKCTQASVIAQHRRVLDIAETIVQSALAHYPDMQQQPVAVPA